MHFCFILDNSLTMLQKISNNERTFFDQIKYSLENVIKSLFRNGSNNPQDMRDIVHLFVTSSTQPISSYQDNNQMHLLHQLKNLQCTIPTFSAQSLESALNQLGKFRCLNQTETFLGYREGTVFQPALIFYITDNSNCRQINKIYKKIVEKKLQIRAQYKLITIKYCSPSSAQANLNSVQKFKPIVQKQKQSQMIEQLMKKMNGLLYHVYNAEDMINLIQNTIVKFSPSLSVLLQTKEYKIYNKQIIKIQFPLIQKEASYLQKIKKIQNSSRKNILTKNQDSSNQFFIDFYPMARRTQVPLPFQITAKHLNQNIITIDQFQALKFQTDFTKQYVGQIDNLMLYMFNEYQILQNKILTNLFREFNQQKKFPLFFQRKKTQYLIGYLRLFFPSSQQNKSRKIAFQAHISFSNFINLNSNIKSFKQRNPSSEQYFQNYISSLPLFYHKFLKHYLQLLNFPQLNFDNINAKPIGVTNLRFYEQRLAQKKMLFIIQKRNYDQHQKNQSQCCSVYSKKFQQLQKLRSQTYSIKSLQERVQKNYTNTFFQQNLYKLEQIKKALGINDYLTPQQIHSISVKKQLEKYNIRRYDDQMDQLVGDLLGNPFKKINKKVKIDDEAQSVWIQPEQISEMKQMLEKQTQVMNQLLHITNSDKKSSHSELKSDNIYDRLASMKEKIANNVNLIQKVHENEQNNKINEFNIQSQQKRYGFSQLGYQETTKQNEIQSTILNQEILNPAQNYIKKLDDLPDQNDQNQIRQQQNLEQTNLQNRTSNIIQEVSSKFLMNKFLEIQIPSSLLQQELYHRNKSIFQQILQERKY